MMAENRTLSNGAVRSPRTWTALGIVVVALFLTDPAESAPYHALARGLGLHSSPPATLGRATYGTLMLVRLLWNGGLWIAVCATLSQSVTGFPFGGRRALRFGLTGLTIGLAVMLATLLSIWGLRAASVAPSGQTVLSAFGNGFVWLVLDFVGSLGEEILGRAVILVVVERYLGWKGAVLVSGVMFSGIHLANPGASRIWIVRLFFQGALLAYAVFSTRSIWWSVGYHTGWNWVSAPLFGAAGSGYMDEGHILDFVPHGSVWITGGTVGPEGSIFAFLAVLAALGLLTLTTKREVTASDHRPHQNRLVSDRS